MMYSLDEVGLIPARISQIKHRGSVNPYVENNKLPIFVSPMTCLINKDNWSKFKDSKVIPIYPVRLNEKGYIPIVDGDWMACTLDEFKKIFVAGEASKTVVHHILIDCANGHMEELFTMIKSAKQIYGNKLVVMMGNIANPDTYEDCCLANVDYVRIGIGGGSGCTTSVQTGIHTSMAYILEGINMVKHWMDKDSFKTKVVADGGINTISKAIKALALGADYVMMGKVFAECKEVNADNTVFNYYYGQSSRRGQLDRFGYVKSNPEGTELWVPVKTSLKGFTDKFEAALRSAMSYCNAFTLKDFIGKVEYEYMTVNEFESFNK